MDKLHATIHKASRSVRLDPTVKAGYRRTLEALASSSEVAPTGFRLPRALAWALVAVIIASTGATVSYASTQAIPGDALYGMKVNLVEPAETALAFSEEAKADVAVVHLQRRFQEAATLSAQGTLDQHDEQLAQLAAQDVATVDRDDQPVARARFQALAATYAPDLKLRDITMSRFAAAVHLDESARVSDDVAQATAREQLAIAKEKGSAAEKTGNTSAAVAFRLKAAGRLSQDANDELDKGSYQAALKLSSAAAQAALEAQLFASLSSSTTSTAATASTTASSTHSTSTTHSNQHGSGNGSGGSTGGNGGGGVGGVIHGLLH